ncbi:MAG: DNA cytosine methyltransferase [Planctomycetes bacterium]|nr:DNA cytosine methyltransferase [Planctomycetota bacterium]
MRTIHLFAGAGGGLLADLILGHTPVCAVEWDAYCCAVLRERAADGWFPGLHVHEGDVRLFDPSPWAGRVDCLHAGFPCQDISVAGKGAGLAGERSGLWSEVRRAIGVIRPAHVMLENSPAIVGRGLDIVLADLAALGYDARWLVLGADDVGAPHRRERWWCRAWRTDADRVRQLQPEGRERDQRRRAGDVGSELANADGAGPSDRRSSGVSAPRARRSGGIERRGGAWWESEPDVGRVAHGVAARAHQVAALGNGQVPLCAAAAWRLLGGPMTVAPQSTGVAP